MRPGLAACLKALREGDALVLWKLDRLGRDLRHLVNTVHDLTVRGVGLKVLTDRGAGIDTTTPAGKLVFHIFAALAERSMIHERTRAGLDAARARKRVGGRPRSLTDKDLERAKTLLANPETSPWSRSPPAWASPRPPYTATCPEDAAASMRWVNDAKARYYQAWLTKDLFGDWTLITVWGGAGLRRG